MSFNCILLYIYYYLYNFINFIKCIHYALVSHDRHVFPTFSCLRNNLVLLLILSNITHISRAGKGNLWMSSQLSWTASLAKVKKKIRGLSFIKLMLISVVCQSPMKPSNYSEWIYLWLQEINKKTTTFMCAGHVAKKYYKYIRSLITLMLCFFLFWPKTEFC